MRTAIGIDAALKRKLLDCPVRYVLSDEIHDCALAGAVEQPLHVRTGLRQLHIPHSLFWVEWREERGAEGAKSRAGVLVEADASGRSGQLHSVWMDAAAGPYRSPAHFAFDFDRRFGGGSHVRPRADPRDQHYDSLFDHTVFVVEPQWLESLRRRANGEFKDCVYRLFTASARDFPFLCSLLLMMMDRRTIAQRASDLAKLNRARARKGAAPLLDHIELHVRLDDARAFGRSARTEVARECPRRHWVRGHFVTRDDKVFWRRNHLRGDANRGEIATKTLHVER